MKSMLHFRKYISSLVETLIYIINLHLHLLPFSLPMSLLIMCSLEITIVILCFKASHVACAFFLWVESFTFNVIIEFFINSCGFIASFSGSLDLLFHLYFLPVSIRISMFNLLDKAWKTMVSRWKDALKVRELIALAENQGSIASTHMVAQSCL